MTAEALEAFAAEACAEHEALLSLFADLPRAREARLVLNAHMQSMPADPEGAAAVARDGELLGAVAARAASQPPLRCACLVARHIQAPSPHRGRRGRDLNRLVALLAAAGDRLIVERGIEEPGP